MPQRIDQIDSRFSLALCLFLVASLMGPLSMVGCSGTQPTIPNPFNMADRVPPPIARTPAPGTAQPYYPANANPGAVTLPPGALPQSGLPQSSLPPAAFPQGGFQQPAAPSPQGFTPQPTFQSQPSFQNQAQPFGALPNNKSAQQLASKPGDSISIPTDNTSLRFGSPTATTAIKTEPTYLASNASRPATANSWVSGSAPVRSAANTQVASQSNLPTSNSLRVRVPGATSRERRPVSVASLQPDQKQVQIKPLPANDPNATVGWR